MRIKRLPAGFVVPAQPVMASRPPSGPNWVHEIKHDGYRRIVRRDGPAVRPYTRNAYDWTVRLPAIAAAAQRIKANSFMIDCEAVVGGPGPFPSSTPERRKLSNLEGADDSIADVDDEMATPAVQTSAGRWMRVPRGLGHRSPRGRRTARVITCNCHSSPPRPFSNDVAYLPRQGCAPWRTIMTTSAKCA
jgi:hypothetical protein